MKKTRLKIVLPNITTRDEAEVCVDTIALLTLSEKKITADMDAQILEIRKRCEPSLNEVAAALKTETEKLRSWAEANPAEFPKDRKSIQFANGVIGFRTGTPTVVLFNRSWTWKKVIEAIKNWKLDSIANFLRNTPEVAKDEILAANKRAKDPAQHAEGVLKPIGLKIAQNESFFVEPDLTKVEQRQSLAS